MLFDTLNFFSFLAIVLAVHSVIPKKFRPVFLLIASYFFYASWDARFLSILILSTLIDYLCGIALGRHERPLSRKILLGISVCANLAILCTFKYFNFFAETFKDIFAGSSFQPDERLLNFVLPIGISFYTFQTMSYSIDVFRRKIKPEPDLVLFSLYVAFFPQLVAGPIERAANLLSQLRQPLRLDRQLAKEALWLIVYGLFKKVVVADNLAILVQPVFNNPESHHGLINLLALYGGAIYHYADFSGYSDMACGIARLFGVRLMYNFKMPLFQSNPRSFWSHWHISLTLWFRDYVYIPLRHTRMLLRTPRLLQDPIAVIITFGLIGIWHGAKLHFLIWGLVNGGLIAAYNLLLPSLRRIKADNFSSHFRNHRSLEFLKVLGFQLWFIPAMGAFMVCKSLADALKLLSGVWGPYELNGGLLVITMASFALPSSSLNRMHLSTIAKF